MAGTHSRFETDDEAPSDIGEHLPTAMAQTLSRVLATLADWPDCSDAHDRYRVQPAEQRVAFELDGTNLWVNRPILNDAVATTLALREAFELGALHPSMARTSDAIGSLRILAHVTAVADVDIVHRLPIERSRVTSREVVDGIRRLVTALPDPDLGLRRSLVSAIGQLLRNRDADLPAFSDGQIEAAARASMYALPTSILLTSGGKDGQAVDWLQGSNKYGVRPLPQPTTISLSSCTASPPSEAAYEAARQAKIALLHHALADDLDLAIQRRWEHLRVGMAEAMGLGGERPPATILPTPSGTDAESVATAFALGTGRSLASIFLGPLEVGSGTLQASLGRAFSTIAPSGRRTEPGELLTGMPDQIELATVEIRSSDGHPRDPVHVEAEVGEHLERYAGSGKQLLLHTIDGSKTGIRLPQEATLRRWEDMHGGRLDVVVDAAQLRLDDDAVRRHIAAGRMVIATGSKFFAGPPFCGVLIVPPAVASRLASQTPPAGLADYLDRHAIPAEFRSLRDVAVDAPNIGLLLRWSAALEEMHSFLAIPAELRKSVTRQLSELVSVAIARTPHVENVPSTSESHEDEQPSATIFTLRLHRSGSYLDDEELRLIQVAMRKDLSEHSRSRTEGPAETWLGRRVDVGQPVALGPGGEAGAGIRVAYSAPAFSRIVQDSGRGPDVGSRLRRELADTEDALKKLSFIVERWHEIFPAEANDAIDGRP
jgi:hypothetical protein